MNHPFIYVGCFINYKTFHDAIRGIRVKPLPNDIRDPHVTFSYKPIEVNQSLFGSELRIKIVGYGNDGKNEGLRVCIDTSNQELQSMIERIAIPHITIAVSDDGKPVNTKNIRFDDIEPIELTGKFGGYTKWRKVIVTDRKKSNTISNQNP